MYAALHIQPMLQRARGIEVPPPEALGFVVRGGDDVPTIS